MILSTITLHRVPWTPRPGASVGWPGRLPKRHFFDGGPRPYHKPKTADERARIGRYFSRWVSGAGRREPWLHSRPSASVTSSAVVSCSDGEEENTTPQVCGDRAREKGSRG